MEFITKQVQFTKWKGYVQIFADHQANRLIEEWNKYSIFIFLDYLRKKKKIQFNKRDMKKIYESFINNED